MFMSGRIGASLKVQCREQVCFGCLHDGIRGLFGGGGFDE
jgi:hypothetical protein